MVDSVAPLRIVPGSQAPDDNKAEPYAHPRSVGCYCDRHRGAMIGQSLFLVASDMAREVGFGEELPAAILRAIALRSRQVIRSVVRQRDSNQQRRSTGPTYRGRTLRSLAKTRGNLGLGAVAGTKVASIQGGRNESVPANRCAPAPDARGGRSRWGSAARAGEPRQYWETRRGHGICRSQILLAKGIRPRPKERPQHRGAIAHRRKGSLLTESPRGVPLLP
jgi:hypothetical protein